MQRHALASCAGLMCPRGAFIQIAQDRQLGGRRRRRARDIGRNSERPSGRGDRLFDHDAGMQAGERKFFGQRIGRENSEVGDDCVGPRPGSPSARGVATLEEADRCDEVELRDKGALGLWRRMINTSRASPAISAAPPAPGNRTCGERNRRPLSC